MVELVMLPVPDPAEFPELLSRLLSRSVPECPLSMSEDLEPGRSEPLRSKMDLGRLCCWVNKKIAFKNSAFELDVLQM